MAAIVATVTMTSCSNDDEAVNNSDRVEVKFSTGNIASVQTRVNDQTWAAGDSIGIYMVKETPGTLAAGNILENADNIRYNSVGGTGTAVAFDDNGTKIYYPVSGDVKFIAYYPYTASLTDYKLPVNVSNQINQSAIDVLYAPAGTAYSKTSPNAALPFEHKLVKLVFNISNGAGVTSPLTNALTVAISNQQTTGELNLVNGVVAITGTSAPTTINALVSNGGATAEAIVLPDTHNGTFTFTNAAGEAFTATIPDATFVGGSKYTYTVTLTKANAVITGSIAVWNTGGGSVTAQ
ncbi:hypothetical protein FACS1894182_04740 [Bacteroidia bacterium]|nr:hypothetical protein FACS1894182_04740 [Bacteroidia bacterium]